MFGKGKRLEKKVERGEGRRASAEVLKVTTVLPGSTPYAIQAQTGTFRLTLRVEPDDEPAFEAHTTIHVSRIGERPNEGDRIPVFVSGQDVAWDHETSQHEHGAAAAANLHLSDVEKDRFRTTLLRKLDQLHDKGKMSDSEYAARKAEIEADPDLNP